MEPMELMGTCVVVVAADQTAVQEPYVFVDGRFGRHGGRTVGPGDQGVSEPV